MRPYTRGPWILSDIYIENADGNLQIAEISTDDESFNNEGDLIGKTLHDAYLIAAAPELLEALKATLEEIERVEADVEYKLPCGDKARAAIAKAEGSAE